MKRIRTTYLAAATLLALSAAPSVQADSHFAKVPVDTPFYVGTTEAANWLAYTGGASNVDALSSALGSLGGRDAAMADESRFFESLAEVLLQGGDDGGALIAQPGRAQLYLQGMAPVVRIELIDGAKVRKNLLLRAAREQASIRQVREDGTELWLPTGESPKTTIFAALDGDDLVLSLRSEAAGFPAAQALVNGGAGFDASARLKPAFQAYGLESQTVAWLDLQRLQQNLLDESTPMHTALKGQVNDPEIWQTLLGEDCQHDITRLIENTPHLLASTNLMESAGALQLGYEAVWPLLNAKSQAAWQGLQGQVLDTSASDSAVRFGLGLSGAGVPAFIEYLATDLSSLRCPLWRNQAADAGMGMVMAGSMSTMFGSVTGLSAQVFDFDLNADAKPDPSSIDAQVSVLSDSPSLLMLMLRSAVELPADIPQDGTPVELQTPLGLPLQLSVYPHSINVFMGAAAAQSVAAMGDAIDTKEAFSDFDINVQWVLDKMPSDTTGKPGVPSCTLATSGGSSVMPYGFRFSTTVIGEDCASDADEQADAPEVVKTKNTP